MATRLLPSHDILEVNFWIHCVRVVEEEPDHLLLFCPGNSGFISCVKSCLVSYYTCYNLLLLLYINRPICFTQFGFAYYLPTIQLDYVQCLMCCIYLLQIQILVLPLHTHPKYHQVQTILEIPIEFVIFKTSLYLAVLRRQDTILSHYY